MVRFTDSLEGIKEEDLAGFFQGWPNPPFFRKMRLDFGDCSARVFCYELFEQLERIPKWRISHLAMRSSYPFFRKRFFRFGFLTCRISKWLRIILGLFIVFRPMAGVIT